jgi:PilZ domain-containing protein
MGHRGIASGTQRSSFAFLGMDDKRGGPRQRVLKSGKIVFAGGSFSVDCTIRNMSASGARLQVPTSVAIPDRFTLVDVQARIQREATVAWRNGDVIGVRFEPPKP